MVSAVSLPEIKIVGTGCKKIQLFKCQVKKKIII